MEVTLSAATKHTQHAQSVQASCISRTMAKPAYNTGKVAQGARS